MQITYIHQHFKRPTEGGGGRPYQFARRLVANGHHVTMIAAGGVDKSYHYDGINVRQLKSGYRNTQGWARRIYSFVNFMVRASFLSRRIPADLVFASSTPLTVAIPGILASSKQRAPFVFEVRDLWPTVPIALGYLPRWLHGPARQLERAAYSKASEIIALSPWMESGVAAVSPRASTHMIPNCSDFDVALPKDRKSHRDSFGIGPNELVLYYGGSLGYGYDPAWLAELAVACDSIVDVRVLIAGEGAGRDVIARRLSAAGISPASVLLGRLTRSRVLELGVASDIAISSLIDVPELAHNSLNKVFDALATGTPVVFNHEGWLRDIVTQAGAGWMLPRDITQEAVRDLAELVGGTESLSLAGQRARDLGKERFDRDKLFEEFHAVLMAAVRK